MSIDHLLVPVPAPLLETEISFLSSALAPLGIKELLRVHPLVVGMGTDMQNMFLWVSGMDMERKEIAKGEGMGVGGLHVAFKTNDRKQVDEFHAAALKAGGKDNGTPGIRKEYHEGYYAAFVIDPAGHNIEAVVREWPEESGEKKE